MGRGSTMGIVTPPAKPTSSSPGALSGMFDRNSPLG
jgi:hypothetical protein